jgi:ATP-dependent DNA helicase RecG
MNEEQLLMLIERGEDQSVEFKSSLKLRQDIGVAISAFANAASGVILIGVSDDGEVTGVTVGRKTLEDFANWVKRNTDPQVYPDVKVRKVNGKDLVQVSVKESDEKPVFFKDRAYQRVGKTNQRLSASKLRELAKQERVKLHWDERICERATLDDIDEEKVKRFLAMAKEERNLNIRPDISIGEALERLELARNGLLTNAAVLLFGKKPQRFFLQAETRCGRFKGTKPIKPFLDMKVFDGSVIDQVEMALDFTLRHINMAAWVEAGKAERQERWEYPPDAIREAIVNAICHRDYEIAANVQVRIFDDRIEIWGCGSLLSPLTVESLSREHPSVLRNPLIGRCFFLIGLIEQWGTGTNEIMEMCRDWELPEPLFREVTGSLIVTLRKYRVPYDMEALGLNERQQKAIEFMKQHGEIKLGEYRELYPDVTERTLRRDLVNLVELGIVQTRGERRGRKYLLR